MKFNLRIPVLTLILILPLFACQQSQFTSQATQTTVITQTMEVQKTTTPTIPVEDNFDLIFDAVIPEWAQTSITEQLSPALETSPLTSDIIIGLEETKYLVGEIQYAAVVSFSTPIANLDESTFKQLWSGTTGNDNGWFDSIQVSAETAAVLSTFFSPPGELVNIVDAVDTSESNNLAIIPFQNLTLSERVLRINDESFFSKKEETLARTLFSVPVYSSVPLVSERININFDPSTLTTVNITGVTALTRATAAMMRTYGNQYPADQILNILTDSDYTHITNEVSFSPDCPPQQYIQDDLTFCSPISTFELLEYIDADVIELTGDHLDDWGSEAFEYTLNLYNDAGMLYYGGGENISSAQTPLKFEVNSNKFAFIGCNAKDPFYAKATETMPGTWHCDLDILKSLILELQQDDYTPIVTIQHLENESIQPPEKLISDFSELSDYSPIILIGSQSHVPKPYFVDENSFIHFGLGNLFFDQINESDLHAQGIIDRLVFYENHLINVEIFPIQFIDWAQTRPMTDLETQRFLEKVFTINIFTQQ